jgi:autotransporter passenger strand-loop-strand repeat protein
MATYYTAPPNQSDLVLHKGDILDITSLGRADGTFVENGGQENVLFGGESVGTTVSNGGVENVDEGGVSYSTADGGYEHVYDGGVSRNSFVSNLEVVDQGGVSVDTRIAFGAELVYGESDHTIVSFKGVERVYGVANGTIIEDRGSEQVSVKGQAHDVTFAGPGAVLKLANPAGLTGVLSEWQVGDTVDLAHTHVSSVSETGNVLMVNYGQNQSVEYTLANQQADTHVTFHSDGSGGTDLVLTTGVQHLHHGHVFV